MAVVLVLFGALFTEYHIVILIIVVKRTFELSTVYIESPVEEQFKRSSLHPAYNDYKRRTSTLVLEEHQGKDYRYFKKILQGVFSDLKISVVKDYGVTGDCATCLKIERLKKRTNLCPRELDELKVLSAGHFAYIRKYRFFIDNLENRSNSYLNFANESNSIFIEQVSFFFI